MSGIEDEVAALREEIEDYGASMFEGTRGPSLADLMARLDRIASQVPQRATRPDGRPLWVRRGHVCADDACTNEQMMANGWRPLYVLPDRPLVKELTK